MRFEFATATRILFGVGSVREAGSIVQALGRRALIVTGSGGARAAPLLSSLGEKQIGHALFPVIGEPSIETVRAGVQRARDEQCDLVIGFGGGSAVDAGKAIAALLTNHGEVLDSLEVIGLGKPLTEAPAPYLAIPTTAGTG